MQESLLQVRLSRPLSQVLRRPFGQEAPRLHQPQAVAPLCLIHDVGGDQDGDTLVVQGVEVVLELYAELRVHTHGGFVKE